MRYPDPLWYFVPMSESNSPTVRIAVAQASPVFMDRDATVEKACGLIAEAGRAGARLVVFPEAFLPGYPDWVWSIPAGKRAVHNALYGELVRQSVRIGDESTRRLGQAAKAAGLHLVMGINEINSEGSGASIYNTLLYMGPDGEVLGRHRKLVPTGGERLIWASGDGSTMEVYDTPFGRLGGLTCWENYMPLARYAMCAQGVQIYVAATWDRGEPWLSTLRHMAREGGMYVIGACMALRRDDIPDRYEFKQDYKNEWINVGDSAVVDPLGNFIAGPLNKKEEILYAEIDPRLAVDVRSRLDVAGHYSRPDIFQLMVRRTANPPIQVEAEMLDSPLPLQPGQPAGAGPAPPRA